MQSLPRVIPLTASIPEAHRKVFETLLGANEESGVNSVLRVAGGWVRDMLLGVRSNDIDIALEATTPEAVSGVAFARMVSDYEATKSGKARTVSVIRVNPALSKHIETATVCVNDIPVEFCALRTDDYCSDSRIPQVRAATPLQDALRRDFTINALFYNLNTRQVEDYTGGLQDLENRVLRCPLSPKETFMDDPLRLLRGIRFVGQLGELHFSLHPSIASCVDDHLLETLLLKVSRERIGKEFTKMMCGGCPEKCVDILHSMRVLERTLLVEVYMKQLPGKKKLSAEVERTRCLMNHPAGVGGDAVETVTQLNSAVSPSFSRKQSMLRCDGEEKLTAMVFELVIPFFRGVTQTEAEERLYALCINGLKLSVSTFNGVRRMVGCYNALRHHMFRVEDLKLGMSECSTRTMFDALGDLHDHSVIPKAFRIVLLTYLLVEERRDLLAKRSADDAVSYFEPLWRSIESHPNLLDAYKLQLPIVGNELKTICGLEAKNIGTTLLEMRRYVVLHPNATREDLIVWVKALPVCGGS